MFNVNHKMFTAQVCDKGVLKKRKLGVFQSYDIDSHGVDKKNPMT